MAYSVYYVTRGLALNLTEPDLGHPDLPDLWDEIYPASKLPLNQLQCLQCLEESGPTCPEFLYLRVRDGRREAVHHNTNIRAHITGETDAHKALKERTASKAASAGFEVDLEERAAHGKRRTDVLIHGVNGYQLGVEAQLSYIPVGSVRTRTATAEADGITPMWVVNHDRAHPINRAPWCMVPNADWRFYLNSPGLKAQGGVRHIEWESCDERARRGERCPDRKRRGSCGRRHPTWSPIQVPYDDLIVRAAAQEFVPISLTGSRRMRYYWVPAEHRAEFEAAQEPPTSPSRQASAPLTPRPLDPTCKYGQDSGYRSEPSRPRDDGMPVAAPAPARIAAPVLAWRDARHWNGGRREPCIHCGKPAFLLDDGGNPAHKVCAEADVNQAGRDSR